MMLTSADTGSTRVLGLTSRSRTRSITTLSWVFAVASTRDPSRHVGGLVPQLHRPSAISEVS